MKYKVTLDTYYVVEAKDEDEAIEKSWGILQKRLDSGLDVGGILETSVKEV